jgi:hypothetical protein
LADPGRTVLADHELIPGGELPVEIFALAVTLFVMLPQRFG